MKCLHTFATIKLPLMRILTDNLPICESFAFATVYYSGKGIRFEDFSLLTIATAVWSLLILINTYIHICIHYEFAYLFPSICTSSEYARSQKEKAQKAKGTKARAESAKKTQSKESQPEEPQPEEAAATAEEKNLVCTNNNCNKIVPHEQVGVP